MNKFVALALSAIFASCSPQPAVDVSNFTEVNELANSSFKASNGNRSFFQFWIHLICRHLETYRQLEGC